MRPLLLTAAALLMAFPVAAQAATYTGQQARDIKALSAQDTADLLAGRGMGMARPGELNHYSGPAHVLELGDKLGLSVEQRLVVQRSFDRMAGSAKPLGAELVRRERALDQAFKQHSITPADLASETAAIGQLQGRLRAVHLAAHLETRAILTPEQVARYDELRGYANAAPSAAPSSGPDGGRGGHHGMHPG